MVVVLRTVTFVISRVNSATNTRKKNAYVIPGESKMS